jgi:hypothetical protein
MHIGNYMALVHKSEQDLALAFLKIEKAHGHEPDVAQACKLLASWSSSLAKKAEPFVAKYGEEKNKEPDRLMHTLFKEARKGSLALLRDLHDLWLMAQEAALSSILLRQGASSLQDKELMALCDEIEHQSKRQAAWLLTRMKSAAPQTLVAAE